MGSDDPWLTTGIDPWSAGRVSKNGVAAATTTTSTGPAPRASTPPPSDSEESPSAAKAGPPSSWINGSANGIGHAPKPKHPPASLKPQAFQAPPPSGPAVPSGPAGPAPHGPPVAKVAPAVTSTNARSEGEGKASTCLLQVPHSGFADAKDPDLKKVSQGTPKSRTFHIQIYKDSPDERLGLRTEVVDGVGCGSAGRVHRIFHGGLIEEWNRMAVACGMPDWEVEVNDVIIGVNGRMEYHPDDFEVRTATDLDLLIMRGPPAHLVRPQNGAERARQRETFVQQLWALCKSDQKARVSIQDLRNLADE
ncbi:Uncharacterized protein (Fragment) [Durusdinium trenchii]|uniref:PDZ domain-containing protein n=1 Tax=Durusdinium trenchii TaxID=1381693 RepID=A0ABP0Q0V4_9DINO